MKSFLIVKRCIAHAYTVLFVVDLPSQITDFTTKIGKLEEKFEKRCSEFRIIQEELRIINDFLEKKTQMEQELRNV